MGAAATVAASMPDKKENKSELCNNIFRLSDMKNNRRHGKKLNLLIVHAWRNLVCVAQGIIFYIPLSGAYSQKGNHIFPWICTYISPVEQAHSHFMPVDAYLSLLVCCQNASIAEMNGNGTERNERQILNRKSQLSMNISHYILIKHFHSCQIQMMLCLCIFLVFSFVRLMRWTTANP